jgi:hypothetical protein
MLLCLISTTFWQCQKEELETIEPQNKNSLNISVVHGERVFKESALLRAKVTSLKRKNTAARLTSSLYNFSIEEEHVQVIIGDDYTQYTFNVERDSPTPNLLENYVCKIYTDGEVFQYLMGYPYSIGQNGITYQMQNSTIQVINDENILVTTAGRGFPPGCVPEFLYEVLTYECTNYSCTGNLSHAPGEECPCGSSISPDCNQPYTHCSWITTAVYGGCGGGGSTGGDGGLTPPAGGGSGGTGTTTPVAPVVTVPFDDALGLNKECEKIANILDTFPAFKQKVQNFQNDLSLQYEKSVGLFENQSALDEHSGVAGAADTRMLANPSNKYIAYAHTHPNDNSAGTYSVFSFQDLVALSNVINNNKLDADKFAAFLSTGKGTRYALTINNLTKFKAFFKSFNTLNIDFNTITIEEKKKIADNVILTRTLRDKYYDGDKLKNIIPKITSSNVNNELMLQYFLEFLNEADMGVTMFESVDNFETLKRVTVVKNATTLERKDCTN